MNSDQNQNDPKHWKWGVFYVNPDDKRVMVPKRVPMMGFTLNFGNRKTGLYLVGIGLVITISLKIAEYLQNPK